MRLRKGRDIAVDVAVGVTTKGRAGPYPREFFKAAFPDKVKGIEPFQEVAFMRHARFKTAG